ncbi:alpha-amylase family glycosyl hydrolase [Cohnella thailandensis]|uniref:Cyclomaltodextrin glucanotransferase n=1 Tax=Cohnella thailandensis TaxID=557557 RepID=A0A841T2C9_9BACL|nr:alpha-amylase family glycosyl hydrolase [Cohnella thailandensis]MBB6636037.1 IPT/TIG domain-containing protein [Cohnella thailandensis]MBP1976808.1 glycosidase [Cohnella thailandensis]
MGKRKMGIRIWATAIALTLAFGGGIVPAQQASALTASGALGPLTPKDVVYQIITDRFVDGDTSNNVPSGSSSALFDDSNSDGIGDGDDLKLYQGGDWQGIIDKIPYLKDMGVTAVWISAPYENRDTAINDYQSGGGVNVWTSFHGYHVRNYFATNKHFGMMQEFEELRDALHDNGMKIVIDFVSNHTSRWQNPTSGFSAEDGKLYEPDKDGSGNYVFDSNGNPVDYNNDGNLENLLADPNNDVNGWFHGIGDRGSDSSRFGYRHKDLGSLADFSQENGAVAAYLEKAALFWKSKGVDGFRHDATLHENPAFVKGFKDAVDSASGGPVSHFGEFFIGRPDPKYDEYQSFPDRTGVNNLDFEFFRAATNAFGSFSETMSAFGSMLTATSADYEYENQAVTFLDNHDVTRFRYIQPNNKPYHAALAALLTSRGTPNIYYGTEQYLTSADSSDIAGRVFMQTESTFDTTTTAYQTIKKLSALRQANEAVAFGTTDILYSTNDVLVYKRQFYDKQVIVAINRQPDQSFTVPAINTTLPTGTYSDTLDGLLYGSSATVSTVNGQNRIASFTLSGGEVNVWSYNPDLGTSVPRLGDVVSTMGRAGNTVYIYGTGLGGTVSVKFDTTAATVVSNSNNVIEAIVPSVAAGVRQITVTKGSNVSNPFRYEVLSDDQVQVIFKVNASTALGQNIYVVGSIPELGSWDPAKASEAFLNPNYPEWFLPVSVPKGTTFQYKFIKKDGAGNVIWEGGSNRTFTSSSSSAGSSDTGTLTWQ